MTNIDWFADKISANIDLDAAGIYEWRIEGVGTYIGKSKRLRKRLKAYPRNVARIVANLPYHGDPNKAYRKVHHGLHRGMIEGRLIYVTVLENCSVSELNEREYYWISIRRRESIDGGITLLNS